jgi:hypothetical protein
MSVAPPGGHLHHRVSHGRRRVAGTACRLERPAYSSISRRACLTGWSCRTFREKKNSDAPAVKREAEEE